VIPALASKADSVKLVLSALRALAPVGLSTAPIAEQVFEGACRTR
jgi:hypothetical protein